MGEKRHLLHRGPHGGRSKKLLAGVRFSLHVSGAGKKKKETASLWQCGDCHIRKDGTKADPEKIRHERNCRNRKGVRHPILIGQREWLQVSGRLQPALKIDDVKFYECPASAITNRTWEILALVNQTTDAEGNILHLPFPGSYLQQPAWYRQAVQIVRTERARYQRKLMESEE